MPVPLPMPMPSPAPAPGVHSNLDLNSDDLDPNSGNAHASPPPKPSFPNHVAVPVPTNSVKNACAVAAWVVGGLLVVVGLALIRPTKWKATTACVIVGVVFLALGMALWFSHFPKTTPPTTPPIPAPFPAPALVPSFSPGFSPSLLARHMGSVTHVAPILATTPIPISTPTPTPTPLTPTPDSFQTSIVKRRVKWVDDDKPPGSPLEYVKTFDDNAEPVAVQMAAIQQQAQHAPKQVPALPRKARRDRDQKHRNHQNHQDRNHSQTRDRVRSQTRDLTRDHRSVLQDLSRDLSRSPREQLEATTQDASHSASGFQHQHQHQHPQSHHVYAAQDDVGFGYETPYAHAPLLNTIQDPEPPMGQSPGPVFYTPPSKYKTPDDIAQERQVLFNTPETAETVGRRRQAMIREYAFTLKPERMAVPIGAMVPG